MLVPAEAEQTKVDEFLKRLEDADEVSPSEKSDILNIVWKWTDQEEITERFKSLAITSKNCAQIVAFAVELNLTVTDIKQLMEKITTVLPSFSPVDIPSVAYQLLNLCRLHHPFQAVEMLKNYFNKAFERISERGMGSKQYQELCNCRGMVIFHISRMGVASDHPLVKDLINYMKANVAYPSTVLNLFMLEVILAVSSNTLYRGQIIDILRNLIVRAVRNEKVRQQCAWLAEILQEAVDTKQLINELIDNCVHEKDILITGMEYLGFALLEYKPLKSQSGSSARSVHLLGARLLSKMVRKTPPAVKSIMSNLLDHLVQTKGEEQYIDTLSQLCIEVPMVLQLSHLQQVLQISVTLPVDKGRLVLSSLYPVMRLNKQFRDAVLMSMRKSLSGRSLQHRQIAVAGLMQMLKFAKGLGPLSSTQASFFSQTQSFSGSFVDFHSTALTQARPQDAIYAELFLLFKRCLDQAAYPVKVDVYQGFTDVIIRNQNLIEPALELLVDHLKQYVRKIGEHTGIKLDECFDKENAQHTVKEPLCFLLQTCIHLAVQSNSQSIDEVDNLRDDLNTILQSLSSFLVDWDLGDWDLNESTDMNPFTTDGRNNILKVKFIMSLYIPMMEMCLLNEALTLRVKAEVLLTLFRKYKKLGEYLKDMQEKMKKKEKGKKDKDGEKNESEDEQKVKMQEYEGCAMSIKSLSGILQGIFGGGGGGHPAALDLLRSPENRDFQTYILEMVRKMSLHLQKTGRPIRGEYTHGDRLIMNVCKVARSLLCLVVRPAVFNEQDLTQRLVAMQSIGACAAYMEVTHPLKLMNFLVGLEGSEEVPDGIGIPEQTLVAIRHLQKLGERLIAAGGDSDVPTIKALIGLFDLIEGLSRFLPPASTEVQSVFKWYEKICKDWDITDGPATKAALTGLIHTQIRHRANTGCITEISKQVRALLGDIDENVQVQDREVWGVVKEGPRPQLFCILVDQLEQLLENVTFVIGLMANATGDYAETLDKGVCARLSLCVASFNELAQTNVPEGVATESLLRGINRFFVCLSLYAKRHKGIVVDRLEKLVREIGQKLTQCVYDLFTFLGTRGKDAGAKRKKGKRSEAQKVKIIRESRPIATLSCSIEEAVKNLIKLGKKSKVDLASLIKLATARDFRIKAENIESDANGSGTDDEEPSLANAPQSTPLPPPSEAPSRKKRRTESGDSTRSISRASS